MLGQHIWPGRSQSPRQPRRTLDVSEQQRDQALGRRRAAQPQRNQPA
jgi:hypothetical protein